MYRKRLIASAVSIFTLGVVFGMFVFSDTFSYCAILTVVTVLSAILLAVSARPNGFVLPKSITAIAIAVAVFSLGALLVSINKTSFQKYAAFDGDGGTAEIKIVEIGDSSIDGRIITCDCGVPNGTLIRLYPDNFGDFPCVIGDKITVDLRYDYKEKYNLYSKGIKLTAYGSIYSKIDGDGLFYFIRSKVNEYSGELFGKFESASAISKGVTIGDRSSIDSYLFSVYRSSGLSHVLAISGFHISIIAMSLFAFLNRWGVKRAVSSCAAISVAVFYCSLVGFNAGAVRSVIMLTFLLISQMFLRNTDGFTTLFIALFVLLIINPFSLYSAGFQLSFLCCLGILLVAPYFELPLLYVIDKTKNKMRLRSVLKWISNKVFQPFTVSLVAAVFSFPVICSRFDTVSYASPLVNIISVPLFTVAIICSLISYMCAPISITVAKIIAIPAGVLFDFVTDISQFVYDNDLGVVSSYSDMIWIPIMLSVLMIAALIFLDKKRLVSFVVILCLFCVSLVGCGLYNAIISDDKDIVEYNDKVNKYVYTTAQGGAYVDLGGYNSYPAVVFENGKTTLENYILVEYTENSYKRIEYFSGSLKIKNICVPNPKNDYDVFVLSHIKELANKRNCDIIYFEEYFSGVCPISVFGSDDSILVCADVRGQKIRILGDGFSNAVNCNIAILSDGYSGDENSICSDVVYAPKEYVDRAKYKYYNEYNDRIRIELDTKESDFKIYEP